MSKKLIEETIASFGDVPDMCKRQLDFQKNHFFHLIEKMEDYEWRDLLKDSGVKMKDKEADPETFVRLILNPVKITTFLPDDNDTTGMKTKITQKVLPSLLETKLRECGIYMGPLGGKLTIGDKAEQFTNPFTLYYNPKEKVVKFIYI